MAMAIYCGKCSLAVKTSLWFDNEADAKGHRESKLHAAVSSDSQSRLLQDFRKHLEEHFAEAKRAKPNAKKKTGTEFSMAVQWQFVLFQQREEVDAGWREHKYMEHKKD